MITILFVHLLYYSYLLIKNDLNHITTLLRSLQSYCFTVVLFNLHKIESLAWGIGIKEFYGKIHWYQMYKTNIYYVIILKKNFFVT